jgi:hypothetical protein
MCVFPTNRGSDESATSGQNQQLASILSQSGSNTPNSVQQNSETQETSTLSLIIFGPQDAITTLPAGKSFSDVNRGVGISDGVRSDVQNNSASGRSIDSSSGFGSSSNAVIEEGSGLSETVALRNIGDDCNSDRDSSVGDSDGSQAGSDVGGVVNMRSTGSDSSKGSGYGNDSSVGSGSGSDSSEGSGSGSDSSKGSGSGSDSSKGSGSGSDSNVGSGSGSDSSKVSGSGSDSSKGSASGRDSSGIGSGGESGLGSSSIGSGSDSGIINGSEGTTDSSTDTSGGSSRGSGAGSEIVNSGGSIDAILTSKVSTNVTSNEPLAGNSNLRDVANKSNTSGLITLSDPATNNTSSAPATSPLPTTANPTSKSAGESDTNSEASSTTTASVSAEPVPQVATIVLLKDEAFT